MFLVIGHDSVTDSATLQTNIMKVLHSEQIDRAEKGVPYTKEREVLHYTVDRHEDEDYPDYKYFSYINSTTKQLLDDHSIQHEDLGTIDVLPDKAVILIRNSRFL